jgi:hypothetical protein
MTEAIRDRITWVVILATMFSPLVAANAKDEQAAVNCEQVRAYVAEHGKWRALVDAKLHGATREQIRAARECLK